MTDVIWFALGLAAGVYITSIKFRVRVKHLATRFINWIKFCAEGKRRNQKLEKELKKLREDVSNYNHIKKIQF